ncbi:hypothetical protein GCM10009571_22970 [Agromyces luteolus]
MEAWKVPSAFQCASISCSIAGKDGDGVTDCGSGSWPLGYNARSCWISPVHEDGWLVEPHRGTTPLAPAMPEPLVRQL